MGRSKKINVLAATQKPTVDVIGSTNKSNYTLRLVGKVKSPKDAEVAAGTSGTGAEFLPGNGSFLYVDGMECRRFQAYFVPDVEQMVAPLKLPRLEQMPFLVFGESAR
jgi:S-DNA-T family DNA segregation ATPase FtsK/SpoIIIE